MEINNYLDNTNIAELLDMKQYFFTKYENDKEIDNPIIGLLKNEFKNSFIVSFSVLVDNSLSKIIDLNNDITILDTENIVSSYNMSMILSKKNIIYVNDSLQDDYTVKIKKGDTFRLKNDSIYFLYLLVSYDSNSNFIESNFNSINMIDQNNGVFNLNIKYNYSHLKITVPEDIINKETFKFSLQEKSINVPSIEEEEEFDLIDNKEKFHFLDTHRVNQSSTLHETSILLSSENEKFNSNKLKFFNEVYTEKINKRIQLVDSNIRDNYFNLVINDIWIDDSEPNKTVVYFKIIIPESETIYLSKNNDYRIFTGKSFYSIEVDNDFLVSFK